MEKTPYHISFSGGRTSGYMTKLLLDHWGDRHNFIVTFANTGLEHPKTLDFIRECDRRFGFNTVWLEAVVHHGSRKAPTHRVVTYETASRKGEPFEEVIKKYGIPNMRFPGCTRDLKLNPIKSYLASLGIQENQIPTAIGIRNDELRRVNAKVSNERVLHYPLINEWPTDKQDVLDWWSEQEFDLEIDEFEGNCQGCWKKSFKKHFMQIARAPEVYNFHRRMEAEHLYTGPQKGHRHFFRGDVSTERLFEMYHECNGAEQQVPANLEGDVGSCSESCELYETEVVPASRLLLRKV